MKMLEYMPALVEDIPLIFDQCRDLVNQYEDLSRIDYEKVMAWMRNKVEMNIKQYVCVLFHGEKAAFYRLVSQKEGTELDDFYVLPQFRNMGIGSQILKRCIMSAQKPLYLYVFSRNTGAISLYNRYGFVVTEQVSPTRLIMTRQA